MVSELPDTLKRIRLTKEGKVPQKDLIFIKDQDQANVLLDQARDTIIAILKEGKLDTITTQETDVTTGDRIIREKDVVRHSLSVSEIEHASKKMGKEFELSKSQIYHHLPVLIENGYVIKEGYVKKGKERKTDYYRRTAKVFVFREFPGMDDEGILTSMRYYMTRFESVFGIQIDGSKKDALAQLLLKRYRLQRKSYEAIVQNTGSDVVASVSDITILNMLVEIHAMQNSEYLDITEKVREMLFDFGI